MSTAVAEAVRARKHVVYADVNKRGGLYDACLEAWTEHLRLQPYLDEWTRDLRRRPHEAVHGVLYRWTR